MTDTTALYVLPAGTICQRNGIPFELTERVIVRTNEANWPLIKDEFKPTTGEGKEQEA